MRPLPILVLTAGLCFLLGAGTEKAAPPAASVLATATEPDAAAMKSIEAFAAAGFGQIATGSPEEVKEARKSLAALLRKPECTLVFYNAFLKAAKPSIDPILASGDGFRATNALMVLRQVKSPEAVTLMLDQCNAGKQKLVSVRIAGGSMLAAMITGKALPVAESDRVARAIRENVEAETSALAAARSMEALAAIAAAADSAKMAAQARGALNELIASSTVAASRTAQAGSEDFAGALFRGLIGIRDQCVKMPQADQSALGGNEALKELLSKVNALKVPSAGRTADAARELAAARTVADALSQMVGLSKPKPAKK